MTCLACGKETVLGARLTDTEWLCQDCVDEAVRHFREAEPTARQVSLLDWVHMRLEALAPPRGIWFVPSQRLKEQHEAMCRKSKRSLGSACRNPCVLCERRQHSEDDPVS